MGIFDRVSRLFKSNANAALDKMQDTGKEVEQLLLDMEEALRRARGDTQKGMAAEKLLAQRVSAVEKRVADWERHAQDAVRAGDDDLAAQALQAQQQAEQEFALARREHAEAAKTAAVQQEALKKLEARLREAKQRKGTIKAKIAVGKTGTVQSDALAEFERMAGRVDDSEGMVEAERELAESMDEGTEKRDALVKAKFDALPGSDVDDRLAALKKKLDQK